MNPIQNYYMFLFKTNSRTVIWITVSLAGIQFTLLFDYLVFIASAPTLMHELSFPAVKFGVLVSFYSWGAVCAGIASSFFLDRFSKKMTVLFSLVCFSGMSWLTYCSSSYVELLLCRFVIGGFAGVCGSMVMAILADEIPSEIRGRVVAFVFSFTPIAQLVGVPVGLFLVDSYGWNAPYLLSSVLGVVWFLSLSVLIKKVGRPFRKMKDTCFFDPIRPIVFTHSYRNAIIASCLIMFSGSLIIPFLPLMMVIQLGISTIEMSYAYTFSGLFSLACILLIGKMSGRIKPQQFLIGITVAGILPVLIFTNLNAAPVYFTVFLFSISTALMSSRIIPLNVMILKMVRMEHQGAFQSINTALLHVGAALASGLAGYVLSLFDPNCSGHGFGLLGVCSIVVGGGCLLLVRCWDS